MSKVKMAAPEAPERRKRSRQVYILRSDLKEFGYTDWTTILGEHNHTYMQKLVFNSKSCTITMTPITNDSASGVSRHSHRQFSMGRQIRHDAQEPKRACREGSSCKEPTDQMTKSYSRGQSGRQVYRRVKQALMHHCQQHQKRHEGVARIKRCKEAHFRQAWRRSCESGDRHTHESNGTTHGI